MHAALLILAPDRHLLAITLPALNGDSRTLITLYEELCRNYVAPKDGEAEDAVQYVQYAEWQHETLASGEMHAMPAVSGTPALALPFERRPSTATRAAGEPVRGTLDADTATRLKHLGQAQSMDPRAIVLACWQTLLWRLMGQAEMTVGLCFEARPFEELVGVCGPFAQQAPIACRCAPDDSSLALARRLDAAIRAAEATLVEGGVLEGNAGLASGVEYVSWPEDRRAGSAVFALWSLQPPTDQARLRLVCLDEPDGLAIDLHDQRQAFDHTDLERIATYFANLARAASAYPERAVATLPILGERERNQILMAFNAGASYAAEPRSVLDLFAAWAARAPDHPAVLCGEVRLTYGELNGAANQLARHLRSLGVGPGTLVGLCLERSTDVAVGILGILKAGGAWAPLDPAYPDERLAFMVEDTGIRILLTQERLRERITLPRGRVVCLDSAWEQIGREAAENPETAVGPDDRAYVIYTSGSTGRPKGVAITHWNLSHYVQALQSVFHLCSGDVYLHTASISFSSSVRQLMMPLVHGATLAIGDYEQVRDPLALFELMAARGVTVWDVVPTFWRHAAHTLADARAATAAASGPPGCGWSLGVLCRELSAYYAAAARGLAPALPAMPLQYGDYAAWQRAWLTGDEMAAQVAYWRTQLAGAPPILPLPTDRPRPAVQSFHGAHRSLIVPAPLATALGALSLQAGVTLYMTLLAAFEVLLARYSGLEDFLVGTPIANRTRVETEGLVGFFVNTLPLRADLRGNLTFRALLVRVRESALGAHAHQDVPFEKLVEVMQPERGAGHAPLIQVLFDMQNMPAIALDFPELIARLSYPGSGTAKFDLSMMVETGVEGLEILVEYASDLFEAATIERFLGHYKTLLEGVVAMPDRPIAALPLLTAGERRQLLIVWNATAAPYPRDACVHELVAAQAARTPEAVAVLWRDERLTYGELHRQARRLARRLRRLGVEPEALVGLCVERSPAMLVGLLGILYAGGAYVPLDPTYPRERLAFMLEDAAVRVLVTERPLRAMLPIGAVHVVYLDDESMAADEAGKVEASLESEVTAANLAYVIYTSGSTGRPKGVQIEHRALTNLLVAMAGEIGIRQDDTLLAVTTLSFDIAALEFFLPLLAGARVAPASRETALDGHRLAALLTQTRATIMQATPATWRRLLTAGWTGSGALKVLCGGEPLPRDLALELRTRCAHLWNVYGPTETTIWSTCGRIEAGQETVSIGRPLANTEVYILDTHGQPAPIGVAGELLIGGGGLARGYLHRPDLTAERFISDPFGARPGARLYRTGDLARYRPDGTIECLGRLDTEVKVRGHRIELGEIEAALRRHPSVAEAVVAAREDRPGDRRLVAYLVARTGRRVATTALRQALEEHLPAHMVPSIFMHLPALPLTPNGKVDRRALPAPAPSEHESADPSGAPTITLHHQLARIWQELLGVRSVGIRANFFDLGGHSLLAARLMAEIERTCGKRIPLAALFATPTIEHLTRVLLEQEGDADESILVPVQPEGHRRPFYFLHGDREGGGFYCWTLARALGPDQPFYALQPSGLRDRPIPRTYEAMAAEYLEAVRAVQPDGPYLLGGFCSDGVVALEMAQQLRAQGQQVDLLVLLDAYLPTRRQRAIHRAIDLVGATLGQDAEARLDCYLRLCAYDARWRAIRRAGVEQSAVLPTRMRRPHLLLLLPWAWARADRPRAEAEAETFARAGRDINGIYRWIHMAYRPRWYPGRVVLFWAAEERARHGLGPLRAWRKRAARVHDEVIPGAHLTFLTTHGQELAESVAVYLRGA